MSPGLGEAAGQRDRDFVGRSRGVRTDGAVEHGTGGILGIAVPVIHAHGGNEDIGATIGFNMDAVRREGQGPDTNFFQGRHIIDLKINQMIIYRDVES